VTSPEPLLSVVIVSWNTSALLSACLRSVEVAARRLAGPVEAIVVDNASTDDSVAMLARERPWVRAIANSVNRGFAAANNQGIEVSRGRFLVLLNPDTLVDEQALAEMVAFMEARPKAGGVGPLLVGADGEVQESSAPLPTLGKEFWRLFHLDAFRPVAYPLAEWRSGGPRRVETVQGACFMLRREVLQEIGSLDERFFIYAEEVDLCRRMQDAGWQLFWLPQASVVHYGGQSTRQVARSMFLELYRSKIRYFRKHMGPAAAWAYKAILAAAAVPRVVLPSAWLLVRPGARAELVPLVKNYAALLTALPAL
jgi:hypothetical protein